MALPVINDVFRVTVNFTAAGGVSPVNVFHVLSNTGTVEEVGQDIWGAFAEGQYGPMEQAYEPGTISVIKLDGATATQIIPRVPGSNDVCLGSGQTMPQVAALVSLRTAVRGPGGRGRVYVGPIVEQAQNGGQMDETTRANLETAWDSFLSDLPSGTAGAVFGIASYTAAQFNPVLSGFVSPFCATQRRRMDAVRG